jgi:16S rRNA (guanine(966)-N(2))-methyltransferase RsmD
MRVTGGQWANRRIAVPPGMGVRPTPDKVRQAIFNSLGDWIADRTVLELFAGSGALSLECLSRGATSAMCVEKSAKHAGFIRRNARDLNIQVSVRVQDAMEGVKQLATSSRSFDFIMADPPYGEKTSPGKRSESWAQQLLDDAELPTILAKSGLLLIGHAKRDRVELPAHWHERKTLKHGDTWIRILEHSSGA